MLLLVTSFSIFFFWKLQFCKLTFFTSLDTFLRLQIQDLSTKNIFRTDSINYSSFNCSCSKYYFGWNLFDNEGVKTSKHSTMTSIRLNHQVIILICKYLQIFKYLHIYTDMKLIINKFIKLCKGVQNCHFGIVSIVNICLLWFIYRDCLTHFCSLYFPSIPHEIIRRS